MQSTTFHLTITVLGPSDLPEILFDSPLDVRKLLSLCGGSIHPRGFGAVAVAWNASILALAADRCSEIALAVSQPAGPTSGWRCHSSWRRETMVYSGVGGRLCIGSYVSRFLASTFPLTPASATTFLPGIIWISLLFTLYLAQSCTLAEPLIKSLTVHQMTSISCIDMLWSTDHLV